MGAGAVLFGLVSQHSVQRDIVHGIWALALGLGFAAAQADAPVQQPEAATGRQAKPGWQYKHEAVAAANPLAADAGARMLRAGGSAIDAAVAVQMVLGLVEPQSSGIGGGAFMMTWDGKKAEAWDGRETAPAGARPDQFMQSNGQPMSMGQAVPGGLSVGTPGVLAMLAQAQREQGKLPWAKLFEPAIELADKGFAISPRLGSLLQGQRHLNRDKQAAAYFLDAKGQPWPVGHVLRNPAYAAVLRRIAKEGPQAFYRGAIAADISARVKNAAQAGSLNEADLAGYHAIKRDPLCAEWRRYRLCGVPPPSSGFLAVAQILTMLGPDPAPLSVPLLHRFIEASRLAFADRALYVGDPDFVAAPAGDWRSLLDAGYLRERAALIGERAMPVATAGVPRAATQTAYAAQAEQVEHGTSHISVVDRQGHAVALTTSVEGAFGSGLMSDGGTGLRGGFLLNNQLTDFSFRPTGADGKPVANRVEAGKRPRSSIAPIFVFEAGSGGNTGGKFVMSVGSPGGSFIIPFVSKTLLGTLGWGMDAQRAIDLPNFGTVGGPVYLETGGFDAAAVAALEALGHRVQVVDLPSGIQAIERHPDGWFGAADPRREGVASGN